jgi:predicted acetyltransferase
MATVELQSCTVAHEPVLAALFQLYIHDFSEHWAGTANGELQEDGRFEPYPQLESYWTDPAREAFFIRADGALAGFALINDHSHSGLSLDRSVAEFFVARKYRRSGVGAEAARTVIKASPGQWELAIARKNTGALAFWRRVALTVASNEINELDIQDPWNGQILRFRVA